MINDNFGMMIDGNKEVLSNMKSWVEFIELASDKELEALRIKAKELTKQGKINNNLKGLYFALNR